MAYKITPPARREQIINKEGYPSVRVSRFFEEISDAFESLPNTMTAIADVSGETIAGNEAKINEILAALRIAGIMET